MTTKQLIDRLFDRGVKAIPKQRGHYTVDPELRNAANIMRCMYEYITEEYERGDSWAKQILKRCDRMAQNDLE